MLKGFREFIFRGNVIDLAVAVVIGAAFGAVVAAFVKDLLTPLIAAIFGKPDFSGLYVELNGSRFMYGDFFNSLVSFLLIAAAVYFFVIVPMTAYVAHKRLGEMPTAPTTKQCPECLSDIPIGARRCAFCTASIGSRAA
jgi:large conductance mechanosensitive channel